jgi:hypothetical protein
MNIKAGNDSKDSKYLAAITKRIAADRGHPRHNGIKMQAHHIISAEGVKRSTKGPTLVKFGYDINCLKNLAFLPCTLQGACHLGVQPHRGNHTARNEPWPGRASESVDENSYDDDAHPESYHMMVSQKVKDLVADLDRVCKGGSRDAEIVQDKVDDLSQTILLTIYGRPNRARLTKIADSFALGQPTGCSGANSVGGHDKTKKCPADRDHSGARGTENITFKTGAPYVPRPGK